MTKRERIVGISCAICAEIGLMLASAAAWAKYAAELAKNERDAAAS